ncbi:NTP transferase domain-containing protein [Cohnella zeiphila]|nr:NTP transferase domain-containing protein [Cohnella zeiphila]
MNLSGAILAGGAGRRMGGTPKAWLPVEGKPMIARIAEQMRSVCADAAAAG